MAYADDYAALTDDQRTQVDLLNQTVQLFETKYPAIKNFRTDNPERPYNSSGSNDANVFLAIGHELFAVLAQVNNVSEQIYTIFVPQG